MTRACSSNCARRAAFSLLIGLGSGLAACAPGDNEGEAAVVQATPSASSTGELDDLDVLKVIPENYTLLLENDRVRVIEARIPPGTEEPPHRHLPGVSVAMTEYVIEHKATPEAEWVRSQREAGVVYYSEGSVHQTRNVGTTPSHTIRIELKD